MNSEEARKWLEKSREQKAPPPAEERRPFSEMHINRDGKCEAVRIVHTDGKGGAEVVPLSYEPEVPFTVLITPEKVRVREMHEPRPECEVE